MATAEEQNKASPSNEAYSADASYQKLRTLLLGPEYESALDDYLSKAHDAERVADVLAQAVRISAKHPDLGKALAPVLNKAIQTSIANNPRQITNVIFPIMGPAIRKSVGATLRDMVQNLNRVLEQSLSARGLIWRVKAWRAGVSYGRYVISQTLKFHVEQVLLVHRDTGLLLHSVIDEHADTHDPELVSGMMSALQDFVQDSFNQTHTSGLSRIEVGDLTLHLCTGPYAVLAIAARGPVNEAALEEVDKTCEAVHQVYAHELADFDGDREVFLGTDELLRRCLLSERIEAEKPEATPWLAWLVLGALALLIGGYAYTAYHQSLAREALRAQLSAEPGYIVLNERLSGDNLLFEVLRDYRARPPGALADALHNAHYQVSLQTHEATLGKIDLSALTPPPPSPPDTLAQYHAVRQKLNDTVFMFHEGATTLRANELPKLARVLEDIHRLTRLAGELNLPRPQLLLMGLADPSGHRSVNLQVSQQRADTLRDLLKENGIDQGILIAWGLGNQAAISSDSASQRRVSVKVIDASKE